MSTECFTPTCHKEGVRAAAARDIAPMAARTGVFVETYYCEGCRELAAVRGMTSVARPAIKRLPNEGRAKRSIRGYHNT